MQFASSHGKRTYKAEICSFSDLTINLF